jgi:hypothetical protein
VNDAKRHASGTYQIVVQGKLDDSWTGWLDGMAITRAHTRDGTPIVVLTGLVADQAALRGLLSRLWDLNLAVIAITPAGATGSGPPDEPEGGAR